MTQTPQTQTPVIQTSAPQISVIINSYNYGRFLAEAIDSVLAQGEGAEIVVVDDGSTDDTPAVLARYAGRVTAIRQPNAGQAAAINRGVHESTGDVLCFLDADDWFLPGKLAAIRAAFDRAPEVGLVYHRLQPFAEGQPVMKPIPRSLVQGDIWPAMARAGGWWPFPMTSALALRREVWNRIAPIPQGFRISADAWLVGIAPILAPVTALPDSLGGYRIHQNGWHRAEDDRDMLVRRARHWVRSVQETNRYLRLIRRPERLHMADHLPYRIAMARLEGRGDFDTRLSLARAAACTAGEPHRLRRWREAFRLLRGLAPLPLPARSGTEVLRRGQPE